MPTAPYASFITDLPEIDIPVEGVHGWLSQGKDHQVVFFDIDPIGTIPPHSHGQQWGTVVEGEMDLTIGGETRRYGPGDAYFIPADVEHAATFLSHFRAIDVFADAHRYVARKTAGDAS
ncbi:MAG: cupin domain-containing protein [Phycisphaerales bacterium]|nr:MAG: cupin domain-containing protein [Phycisphaerales bacterium]